MVCYNEWKTKRTDEICKKNAEPCEVCRRKMRMLARNSLFLFK